MYLIVGKLHIAKSNIWYFFRSIYCPWSKYWETWEDFSHQIGTLLQCASMTLNFSSSLFAEAHGLFPLSKAIDMSPTELERISNSLSLPFSLNVKKNLGWTTFLRSYGCALHHGRLWIWFGCVAVGRDYFFAKERFFPFQGGLFFRIPQMPSGSVESWFRTVRKRAYNAIRFRDSLHIHRSQFYSDGCSLFV